MVLQPLRSSRDRHHRHPPSRKQRRSHGGRSHPTSISIATIRELADCSLHVPFLIPTRKPASTGRSGSNCASPPPPSFLHYFVRRITGNSVHLLSSLMFVITIHCVRSDEPEIAKQKLLFCTIPRATIKATQSQTWATSRHRKGIERLMPSYRTGED